MIRILLFVLLLTAGFVLGVNAQEAAASTADAAAGAAEIKLLNMLFNGNIGFSLGLAIVVLGLITIVKGSMNGGLTLILLGVLITLTPGVYNSARSLFMPMVCGLWSLNCGSGG